MSAEKPTVFQEPSEPFFGPLQILRRYHQDFLRGETVNLEALVVATDIPGYSLICQQGEDGINLLNDVREGIAITTKGKFFVVQGVGDELLLARPRRVTPNESLTPDEHESLLGMALDIQVMFEEKLHAYPAIEQVYLETYDGTIPWVHFGVDYSRDHYDGLQLQLNRLGNRSEVTCFGRINHAKQVAKEDFLAQTEFLDVSTDTLGDYLKKLEESGLLINTEDTHIRISIPHEERERILANRKTLFPKSFDNIPAPRQQKEKGIKTNPLLTQLYRELVPEFVRQGKRKPEHLRSDVGEAINLEIMGVDAMSNVESWIPILGTIPSPQDFSQIQGEMMRYFTESVANNLHNGAWEIDQTEITSEYSIRLFGYHNIYSPSVWNSDELSLLSLQSVVDTVQTLSTTTVKRELFTQMETLLQSRELTYDRVRLARYIDAFTPYAVVGLGSCRADGINVHINERIDTDIPHGGVVIGGSLPSFAAREAAYAKDLLQRKAIPKAGYIIMQQDIYRALPIHSYDQYDQKKTFKGFNGSVFDITILRLTPVIE